MILAESLVRTFGKGSAKSQAVANVSFEVQPQEVVLLFGPSGSGKSTLLALIGGLDRQYSGKLSLFGKDLAKLSDKQLSKLRGERIGFVFQAFHLLDHLSVLDNVQAPGLFANPPLPDAEERAFQALKRVGLADKTSARPSELSGGQRQRVAIARALLRQPELLLCDEPTGNLDRKTGESIIDLFEELHSELGTTLVIVTHEHRLDRIASRTLHLEDGRLVENTEHHTETGDDE
ncbi:MAG: ABC transporter ATP-binding protein [Polyangiaceae bacterium]|nr:ABC transporter ATP-binding protein [Myxococcales bacterium]MCB9586769.1 ABC transporter ATP-binding protein [Polyangiaceae bacterium]MCB9606276.1 ABC transporter ATP-binding protein [Polyangiaceae bacterium]